MYSKSNLYAKHDLLSKNAPAGFRRCYRKYRDIKIQTKTSMFRLRASRRPHGTEFRISYFANKERILPDPLQEGQAGEKIELGDGRVKN